VVLSGCTKTDKKSNTGPKGYPISSDVQTTRQRTIVADPNPNPATQIFPFEIAKYKENGYGTWRYGAGTASLKRLDLMPAGYTGESVKSASTLLNFTIITDIHITDEESPAQAIILGYKGGSDASSSAYSPVMMYTTQVLDAAVQTMNELNKKKRIDFLLSLGDASNSTQYNETRWYIDVLDGKTINPDSGAKDDPVPGPNNDYQDKYQAAGLDEKIPWYQTLGNHDHFWTGFCPPNNYVRQNLVGEEIVELSNDMFTNPLGLDARGYYMGSLDGSKPNGDVFGIGPVADFKTPPKVKAADANRRSLTTNEWMAEFLKTSSAPKGHGFTQADADAGFACYAFEPKSSVPIKVIVLDDTQSNDDPNVMGYGHLSLDQKQYNWLVSELDKGQSEGKLMVIAAHIPIGVSPVGSFMGMSVNSAVSDADFMAKLHTYPNLILWVAGHRHMNVITALKSPDPARPELGFWQVETASLRDFPQQFRMIEIIRNSDNTISILPTDIDPAVKAGSLAELSCNYSVAAKQLFNLSEETHPTASFNDELVKYLSPEMRSKIQKSGTPIKK
jgi:metallophosphoesterase (TIGR03768 family)